MVPSLRPVAPPAAPERARPLPRSVICGRGLRKRPFAWSMRRRVAAWLLLNTTPAERLQWAMAMGVSDAKVRRMVTDAECDAVPVRVDDLLFLPPTVRSGLFAALDEWAEQIARGEL